MGPGHSGTRDTGISASLAHKLSKMLENKGVKTLNKNFYNEFVIEVDNTDEVLVKLKKAGILGGIKLDDKKLLVCTTEMNTESELQDYVNAI